MSGKLRINFVLPPSPHISGGPLAILEYANGFIERGHEVSVTSYPDSLWAGETPFPWFDFKGELIYKKLRGAIGARLSTLSPASVSLLGSDYNELARVILDNCGLPGIRALVMESAGDLPNHPVLGKMIDDILVWLHTMEVMPDCDLNIATMWKTVFPVYLSRKGSPVFFMQHYEEVFFPLQPAFVSERLSARLAYSLPVFKVANSSWLTSVIKERFSQDVPFSNNGLHLNEFEPRLKKSIHDGIVRILTYSRPDEWKGFGDATAVMSKVIRRYGSRVEWNVFGYLHTALPENNSFAAYTYHPKLSFTALGELYATSDIALCPSWYESFPLPPLEAMAGGTAVVTTDQGTEDYAVHEQNALVAGSRDIEAMYSALCRLIEDEELRTKLATAGRRTAEQFTWDKAIINREGILWDIHKGNSSYDVLSPAYIGLRDGKGMPFEKAPADIKFDWPVVCWYEGQLFLIHEGTRRHVLSPELIPLLLERDVEYADVDHLAMCRLPRGFPIRRPSDLPAF